jgi:hypothetical protein
MFNVFNHTTWGQPNNDFQNANMGVINTTATGYAPRTMQLGLRYIY